MRESEAVWLTTGEAAKLCSVKRDTVLKWIKRGRLAASRTAGGHFRVNLDDLQRFRPVSGAGVCSSVPALHPGHALHCWEFFGTRQGPHEECCSCVAFRAAAKWCFRLRESVREAGESFCGGPVSCEDCAYYRQVAGLPARVLVITGDPMLDSGLRCGAEGKFEIQFAASGYDASALLVEFHPGFVVLDFELAGESVPALVHYLARNHRLHGPRVILIVKSPRQHEARVLSEHEIVVGVLTKPVTGASLAAFLDSIDTDHLDVEPAGLTEHGGLISINPAAVETGEEQPAEKGSVRPPRGQS